MVWHQERGIESKGWNEGLGLRQDKYAILLSHIGDFEGCLAGENKNAVKDNWFKENQRRQMTVLIK
jgi:hypothetical protein